VANELETLQAEYTAAFSQKNYQHKGMTDEPGGEFSLLALAAFDRYTNQQQADAMLSWLVFNGGSRKAGLPSPGSCAYDDLRLTVARYRFMAQTNLYFLCRMLGYSKVTDYEYNWYNPQTKGWELHNTHEEICNEFFVRKDPANFGTFESFALDCDAKHQQKERLLLVPRGGFKSSINMADCVQWILCFPEITIAILTGTLRLAQDFVGEVKAHLTLDQNFEKDSEYGHFRPRLLKDKRSGRTTISMIQVLFPEHCVKPGSGKCDEFQTPAVTAGDKEPTIRATGIEQSLAGSHFCLLKLDDVVTEENCETVTRIEDINHRVGVDKALMHAFGFLDIIGTWYDERDYYGVQIAYDDKLYLAGQTNATLKIYRRAVWWPTAECLMSGKVESEWTPADVHMWFPAVLTFDKMKVSAQTEPDVFAIKYLNDPRQINKIKFPRELLIRRTLNHNLCPHQGMIVTTIDTAQSQKSWADYTVILTAIIQGGRFYIVNMVRGRFNEYELPAVIAGVGYRWKPKQIVIEEVLGTPFVKREIRREMEKLQISIPLRSLSLGKGTVSKSKAMKAKPVLRLLGDERMYFVNSCEGLEDIYNELSQFTGTKDDKHDDIVSAVSLMAEVFAPYTDMALQVNAINTTYAADVQAFEHHQMVYGLGKYAAQNPTFAADDNPTTQYQLGQAAQVIDESSVDPLEDLFDGGNRALRVVN
jgi:phage terminase large subunit-like protein